jgi:hypothetical protein
VDQQVVSGTTVSEEQQEALPFEEQQDFLGPDEQQDFPLSSGVGSAGFIARGLWALVGSV